MSHLPLRLEREAGEEIRGEYHYYLARNPRAADAFRKEVKVAFARIQQRPEMYEKARYGTRRFLLKNYPFSVIYLVRDDHIRIIALAHAKRRANYWRKRV